MSNYEKCKTRSDLRDLHSYLEEATARAARALQTKPTLGEGYAHGYGMLKEALRRAASKLEKISHDL